MKRFLLALGLWTLPFVASARSIGEWFPCNPDAFVGCNWVGAGAGAAAALMNSLNLRIAGLIWGIGVLVIFYGAIRIITSRGNSEALEQGKKAVLWAVIGIILMTLALPVINFIWDFFYLIGG